MKYFDKNEVHAYVKTISDKFELTAPGGGKRALSSKQASKFSAALDSGVHAIAIWHCFKIYSE